MVYYNVQDPFKVDMHVACASYQSNQTEKGKQKDFSFNCSRQNTPSISYKSTG